MAPSSADFPGPGADGPPSLRVSEPEQLGVRGGRRSSRGSSTRITSARIGTSAEMSSRVRSYVITMAFRTACFPAVLLVHGPVRWVLLAAAVFLPPIAVVLANQAHSRSDDAKFGKPVPSEAPAITAGERIEVIPGDVVDAPGGRHGQDRVA